MTVEVLTDAFKKAESVMFADSGLTVVRVGRVAQTDARGQRPYVVAKKSLQSASRPDGRASLSMRDPERHDRRGFRCWR